MPLFHFGSLRKLHHQILPVLHRPASCLAALRFRMDDGCRFDGRFHVVTHESSSLYSFQGTIPVAVSAAGSFGNGLRRRSNAMRRATARVVPSKLNSASSSTERDVSSFSIVRRTPIDGAAHSEAASFCRSGRCLRPYDRVDR